MTDVQFEDTMRRYQALVYTVCLQMTHDPHSAEDLAQETFLAAWTHRGGCDLKTVRPWLCRIAANKAKDYLKSAWHGRVDLAGEDEETVFRSSTSPPADRALMEEAGAGEISRMIRELHEPYLKVSILFFLEEKDTAEIAAALSRPEKTVQTQLYRAKRMLQERIRKEGSE